MIKGQTQLGLAARIFASAALTCSALLAEASPPLMKALPAKAVAAHRGGVDDSFRSLPAGDLALNAQSQRKADALANFVEGARLEENGEVEAALTLYQKVLTVDPGEIELASRVAALLTRQEDYPRAIDILKDAIKANSKETGPYLQLAFIYSKYLKKSEQALKYANQAIALDPENIEAYQRIYEIESNNGDSKKALAALDRATKVNSRNPTFWTRLGKLYASIVFTPGTEANSEELQRVNEIFKRAAENAVDDPSVLKDVADYFAASQQVQEAIPLYLRALELQPNDLSAREKLASGFAATNQRVKAMEMLQAIIAKTPDKYQPYDLLAQLQDEEGRALQRAKQTEPAKAMFAKAAANYEQSLLINPNHGQTYLRLAELLIAVLQRSEGAERILVEARARFPQAPEFAYFLGIAQREAKHAQQSVATFEEAVLEAEVSGSDLLTARFYFDYGVAADQAGLYEKAAGLFRKSIALDPANSAEACNYLGFMWADHNMHLDEAEEMLQRALELDPDNGAFLDSRGWLLFRKGKFDDALKDLLLAAQVLTRDDPVVFEHIGDTYAKLNRIPQALEYWQKSITLTPENKALADKIESTQTRMSKGEPVKPAPLP
ncbi:MAG: tetratricopeptide repeat protein [Verrucomicrobiota bacterium]|jgi:tetratricopeptide (TPR) repeat protein|nr:tetratricopeptide repeat protein [Chthoniobacterales bacterium]MDQ3313132.1 tetratricopeptide repeat protein [Verrucomicrobiota bacterium]